MACRSVPVREWHTSRRSGSGSSVPLQEPVPRPSACPKPTKCLGCRDTDSGETRRLSISGQWLQQLLGFFEIPNPVAAHLRMAGLWRPWPHVEVRPCLCDHRPQLRRSASTSDGRSSSGRHTCCRSPDQDPPALAPGSVPSPHLVAIHWYSLSRISLAVSRYALCSSAVPSSRL